MAGKKKRNSRNRKKGKKRRGGAGAARAAPGSQKGAPTKKTQASIAQDKIENELKQSIEDLPLDIPDDVIEESIVKPLENMTLGPDAEGEMEGVVSTQKEIFRPGVDEIKEGEVLDYDTSAYTTMHKLKTRWPCLSFDIIRDNLGMFRKRFPQTLYFACGSQSNSNRNEVSLLKVSELHRTKHDGLDDDDEQNSDSEPEDLDDDPIVEEKSFEHPGCVNRLRNMPQCPGILATWSDQANVHVWDTRSHFKALDTPPEFRLPRLKPMFSFTGHTNEGFAMDWSPLKEGNLLTGDCSKHIYLWEKHESSGWHINKIPFKGHSKSVEDLQWSPTEESVFASCSVDRTIQIWDIRDRKKSQISKKAHKKDVNVISWNRANPNFIVSGSDDCVIKIWDLRNFRGGGSPVGRFNWHHSPITSVAWHPSEQTQFAASSDDNSITFWDLSVEADPEGAVSGARVPVGTQIPPQLMFIHQGQKEIKEVHFHPQIPSLVLSTGNDGLNIFKPDNL